jgi:hypothetical protein
MLAQKELKKLFHQLLENEIAHIDLGGSNITIRFHSDESKFFLTTSVYFGGNFIPNGVRKCLTYKTPFSQENLKTYLTIHEDKFQIDLNYVGTLDNLNGEKFKDLLEEFSWLSDEWRLFLDDHDKNDIVHVRIPR